MVIPPAGADGLARMIVALGQAQIGVVNATAVADESGAYLLTLSHAADAIAVLVKVGCEVRTAPHATVGPPD